jgi:hypothetical protein
MFVSDYEEIIVQRPGGLKLAKSWSGDVWAFTRWASDDLHNFDPHRSRVEFLPPIVLPAGRQM